MHDKLEKNIFSLTLNDDWKSLSDEELECVALEAFRTISYDVLEKLNDIVGKEEALQTVARIWHSMILQPMDFVKRANPETIATALIDCNANETATVIRFISNEKREKVLALLSGEDGYDIRQAEKHVEENIVKMFANEDDENDKKTEKTAIIPALNDDWKSLSTEVMETAVFKAIQKNSDGVRDKLSAIVGAEKAFEIVDRHECFMDLLYNPPPMLSVKSETPEKLAAALKDCSVKEAAAVIRFIDNEKREKVLALLSGEDSQDWKEAERHIEENLANMNHDEE